MKDGVRHCIPATACTYAYAAHVFSTSMAQPTYPPYASSTPSTLSSSPPPQVLLDELEGAVQGLPDHDPDDDAWRPLHQFIVIVKVGRGGGRDWGCHGLGR